MRLDTTQIIFLLSTLLGAIGLIYIIYSRDIDAKKSRLFLLTLILLIGYIISHSVHFLFEHAGDVTMLDNSCHSLLLMIIVTLTFFTWNFPRSRKIGITRGVLILLPSLVLLVLLWTGSLIRESHVHLNKFEAHFTSLYPIYLIWYAILIGINAVWLIQKYHSEKNGLIRNQILIFLIGLIITNLASFIFGLFLPWFLGFYYLVEISPLAFLVGVILFTTVAVGKYNMFSTSIGRLHNFSLTKKIILIAVILVPIIILLIQIPLFRFVFQIETNKELIRYFILSVFGGIIVSISIAFVIIQIISNPINRLKNKAREIEEGNYGIKIDFSSNDEIGELAEAFNTMSDTLKHNSLELKKKEDRISLLLNAFEKSSAAVAVVDSSFQLIEVNAQFCEIIERKKNEVIGNSIEKIRFNTEHNFEFNKIKKELSANSVFKGEIVINDRTILLSVTPSLLKEHLNGYLFVEVDITEQKKLEEQLLKAEKLAALGKMAAVLAHEIKTPLTSIKMNVDIIGESLQLSDGEKENFSIIQTEINRLNNLVKDVLQFSRQMDLIYSEFVLYDLVENIKNQLNGKLKSKNLSFINQTNKVVINADKDKLKQVFMNIIDNSIDALQFNGSIEILSKVEAEPGSVAIYIKDNGSGFPKDMKVFEPFYTTKPSGTGLGLSVAQKIVEQHKGTIKLLKSNPGETTFEITLPLTASLDNDKSKIIIQESNGKNINY